MYELCRYILFFLLEVHICIFNLYIYFIPICWLIRSYIIRFLPLWSSLFFMKNSENHSSFTRYRRKNTLQTRCCESHKWSDSAAHTDRAFVQWKVRQPSSCAPFFFFPIDFIALDWASSSFTKDINFIIPYNLCHKLSMQFL